jgi:hypothetical protein
MAHFVRPRARNPILCWSHFVRSHLLAVAGDRPRAYMLTVARPTNKKIAINPYKRIRINFSFTQKLLYRSANCSVGFPSCFIGQQSCSVGFQSCSIDQQIIPLGSEVALSGSKVALSGSKIASSDFKNCFSDQIFLFLSTGIFGWIMTLYKKLTENFSLKCCKFQRNSSCPSDN